MKRRWRGPEAAPASKCSLRFWRALAAPGGDLRGRGTAGSSELVEVVALLDQSSVRRGPTMVCAPISRAAFPDWKTELDAVPGSLRNRAAWAVLSDRVSLWIGSQQYIVL